MKSHYINIKYFNDRPDNFKSVELGCFPPKDGDGYFRYFVLFYKGKRPSFKTIFPLMKKRVYIGNFGATEEELKRELRKVLK